MLSLKFMAADYSLTTKYGLIKIAFEASTKYPKYPKAKIFQNKSY